MKIHLRADGAEIIGTTEEVKFYEIYLTESGYTTFLIWKDDLIVDILREEYRDLKAVFYEAAERWKDICKLRRMGSLYRWYETGRCIMTKGAFTAIYYYTNSMLEVRCKKEIIFKLPCTAQVIKKAKGLYDKINQ